MSFRQEAPRLKIASTVARSELSEQSVVAVPGAPALRFFPPIMSRPFSLCQRAIGSDGMRKSQRLATLLAPASVPLVLPAVPLLGPVFHLHNLRSRTMTMLPPDAPAVAPSTNSGLEKTLRSLSIITMLMTVPQVLAVWGS
jgi:hypothetical protein